MRDALYVPSLTNLQEGSIVLGSVLESVGCVHLT